MRSSLFTTCAVASSLLAWIASGCTIHAAGYPAGGPGPAGAGLEPNVDRPGSDYRNFDLPQPRAEDCRDACLADPGCAAFTYVNPGVQGPSARCWLKNSVPASRYSDCCVSGVRGQVAVAQPQPGWHSPPPAAAPPAQPQPGWHSAPPPASGPWEMNTDRPGSDFANFDLAAPNPQLCSDACARDGRCVAFTYVNPGVQGPNPRCWLKNPAPAPRPSNCCVSGVKAGAAGVSGGWRGSPPPQAATGMEFNVDRPGSDFANFDLPQARPELCRDACLRDGRCVAFTYVNPGVQGPNARCWLKNPAPAARPSSCCVSGLK